MDRHIAVTFIAFHRSLYRIFILQLSQCCPRLLHRRYSPCCFLGCGETDWTCERFSWRPWTWIS